MPRKKLDSRLRTLIENGVKTGHRSMFVIVGDRGKEAVVNLHYILTKARVKAQPNVLWCYKKDLGFSTHRQKRMRQVKKLVQRGLYNPDKDNPFDLFLASTRVRWTYYKETENILGQTFGMCVLQDFEALTPNILCRTIETVEGGGLVIILLKTMASLKQLYTMTMDVHARFRTEAHSDVVARFNERFLLSLASCQSCLVVDDELNVLPISAHARKIAPVTVGDDDEDGGSGKTAIELTPAQAELATLKETIAHTPLVGALTKLTRTLDQARSIMTCADVLAEKSLRGIVAITAGRGRGKSAALGLSVAAAIGYGYSNIFVTAPHPENLKTVFEFIFKGFDALAYKEHIDYEAIASTNPDFNKAIVRVNIFKDHRQTIQYIEPHDSDKLAQAELVVIDEAAAIPLPLVKNLLVPCVVFMASTINGYEGTGRSLSLKLISQLRKQSATLTGGAIGGAGAIPGKKAPSKPLQEVELTEPIRYNPGDPIESWLTSLMCLDSHTAFRLTHGLPPPKDCELFYVDRDALFSYHKMSEQFLQRLMSLFVSSHYKNSPNDLQLMSDAPAHMLFVLLGPVSPTSTELPDILCAIQVCLEGQISKDSIQAAMSRGQRASGDLIPWTLAQQFQENGFPSLSGARIVRIATHPDATRMGYGSIALQRLTQYFSGEFVSLSVDASDPSDGSDRSDADEAAAAASGDAEESVLTTEKLKPRKKLPPLLVALSDRKPERLHWLGVSYGVTLDLFNFWQRGDYVLVYLRQTPNDLTGEHTAIMLKALTSGRGGPDAGWLTGLSTDFSHRLVHLFSYAFRDFDPYLALSVVDNGRKQLMLEGADGVVVDSTNVIDATQLSFLLTLHDLKRLEAYSRNLVDYHLIVDLLPVVTQLFFLGKLPADVQLSRLQAAILLGVGAQCVTMDTLSIRLDLPVNQLLAYFNKAMRKISNALMRIQEAAVSAELDASIAPKAKSAAARADPVASFEDAAWEAALAPVTKKAKDSGEVPAILSVKKLVPAVSAAAARIEREDVDEVTAKQKHHKSHKKRKKSPPGMLEPTLENVLEQTSLRWVFVGGKGGVGKTTTSCALGMMLAERRSSVLIVSTDPAHNLSDAFDQRFSGTPTLVTGFSNLYCLEIDNKVSEESVGADEPGSGETAGLMKFMSELTASLPGWDEVMGFNAILKTVRSSTFDCVVFDTAPTGHTLRLLALPQAMEKALSMIMGMQSSLGGIFSQLGGLMEGGKLAEMKESMQGALTLLKDSTHTTFVAVCIPEFLSVYETERLVQELTKFDIDIHNVVVNQILDVSSVDSCARCKSRNVLQDKYLGQIADLYEDFHVTKTPLLDTEVRGAALLRLYGRNLMKAYSFGAAASRK